MSGMRKQQRDQESYRPRTDPSTSQPGSLLYLPHRPPS